MTGKVLVAGIGNIFLGDDAFGVEVVRRLSRRTPPGDVIACDFGIRSYDLAYALMEDWLRAILVDALPRGGEPGTIYIVEPEPPENDHTTPDVDAHTMNAEGVLQLVKALGGSRGSTGRVLVVGCEPATLEPDAEGRIGLSAPVEAAVEEAIRTVETLIERVRSEATAA